MTDQERPTVAELRAHAYQVERREAKILAAPRDWRLLLAEAYADAEDHGLGVWLPEFRPALVQEEEAAQFLLHRCEWLS